MGIVKATGRNVSDRFVCSTGRSAGTAHALAAIVIGILGTLSTLAPNCAQAQPASAKPITLVVPFATGGTTDVVARMVGQHLGQALGEPGGVPVLVENRTGAGGVVGWSSVARAAPDGHTLLTMELSFAIAAGLTPNLPYDARKSFTPINSVLALPEVKQRASGMGLTIVGGTPAQAAQLADAEMTRWAALIQRQGIKAE